MVGVLLCYAETSLSRRPPRQAVFTCRGAVASSVTSLLLPSGAFFVVTLKGRVLVALSATLRYKVVIHLAPHLGLIVGVVIFTHLTTPPLQRIGPR